MNTEPGAAAAGTAARSSCDGLDWQARRTRPTRRPGDASRNAAIARRVRDVALHAQRQRLDAGQDQERVGRRQRRAEVAQADGARLHREPEVAERLDEVEAVVRRVRARRRNGNLPLARPVEPAGLDHDAAHRRAVAGQELGHRVDDEVGAPLERPAQVGRRHRVVDDERDGLPRARSRRAPRGRRRRRRGWRATLDEDRLRPRSVIAARNGVEVARRRRTSTVQPSRGNVWRNCVSEPPYSWRDATTWSPGSISV